jgi:FlaA1/EpsC-like NDP-sugar epimerase
MMAHDDRGLMAGRTVLVTGATGGSGSAERTRALSCTSARTGGC